MRSNHANGQSWRNSLKMIYHDQGGYATAMLVNMYRGVERFHTYHSLEVSKNGHVYGARAKAFDSTMADLPTFRHDRRDLTVL